jgi:hypothetical protein
MIPEDISADAVLDMVRNGDLTPQQAEEWATGRHLLPFARKPDPKSFDPMAEEFWTLPMALAWFIWRTPESVVEQAEHYRSSWRRWGTVPPKGLPDTLGQHVWDLIPASKPSISELLRHPDLMRLPINFLFDPATWDPFQRMSPAVSSPYRRLLEALQLDQIHATAVSRKGKLKGQRAPFPHVVELLRSGLFEAREQASVIQKLARSETSKDLFDFPMEEHATENFRGFGEILLPREEVLFADRLASAFDYDWVNWTTEHALGWIAYRNVETFRLVSLHRTDSSASEAAERRLDFAYPNPHFLLLVALREGRLVARPSIEVMHLEIPNPVLPEWWTKHSLQDTWPLRFTRSEVISLFSAKVPGTANRVEFTADRGGMTEPDREVGLPQARHIDPWLPSEKLTAAETRVISIARRLWRDCKCHLSWVDIEDKINSAWDANALGAKCGRKTMERALGKIPGWKDRYSGTVTIPESSSQS